jgi:hypothetical protein
VNERFDVEAVLRDMLDVLRKHDIPIETASLNVSLLDAAFDALIPDLRIYKAGHLHHSMIIDGVPLLFQAQRRYPFDEIVREMENQLEPPIEAFTASLQRTYPELRIAFIHQDVPTSARARYLHSYQLSIQCQFSDDEYADYNQLHLSIFLQQSEATSYPLLRAWLGWLTDEESGGDWGVDIVSTTIVDGLDYAPHFIGLLRKDLPKFFEKLTEEIDQKLANPNE